MKTVFIFLFFCAHLNLFAGEFVNFEPANNISPKQLLAKKQDCNGEEGPKIKNICFFVGSRMRDSSPNPRYTYMYQKKFYEAACVGESDSEEVAAEKIRALWKSIRPAMTCTNTHFDVDQGSILKYAISKNFEDFIDEVIRWKIDLNEVDNSDQRTLLDYVKYHMDRNKGNELESKFKMYYIKLRGAGAKHKEEIK